MTPELLLLFVGLFALVLCLGAALAEIVWPDPGVGERRRP